MILFNRITTTVFDAIFGLFERMNPWANLIVVSAISGAMLLLIFKATSNQKALKAIKNGISGGFLEVRIYKDDPVLMINALKGIFAADFAYLRHAVVPLVIMIVPVMIFLVHADMRYGARPVRPGETVTISVLADAKDLVGLKKISMALPEELHEVVPPVRIPDNGEIDFAIKANRGGDYEFVIFSGDARVEHVFVCGTTTGRAARSRVAGGAWKHFLNPAYPPLPSDARINEVRIEYPARYFSFHCYHINWLIIYFFVSVAFGYSIKGLLRVEI